MSLFGPYSVLCCAGTHSLIREPAADFSFTTDIVYLRRSPPALNLVYLTQAVKGAPSPRTRKRWGLTLEFLSLTLCKLFVLHIVDQILDKMLTV